MHFRTYRVRMRRGSGCMEGQSRQLEVVRKGGGEEGGRFSPIGLSEVQREVLF
jgi:hypothetical protein